MTIKNYSYMNSFIIKTITVFSLMGICFPIGAKENYEETYNMVRAKEEGDKGNYAEAKEFYEKELKEHPDNGYAHLYLAVIEHGNRNMMKFSLYLIVLEYLLKVGLDWLD